MVKRRKRVLFIGEGVTLAHVVRPLTLAKTLDADEFDVHLACSSEYAGLLSTEPVRHWPLDTRSKAEFAQILETGRELFPEETLLRYVRDELRVFDAVSPDLVVSDFRLSATISAPARKIPLISVTNAYWSPRAKLKELPLPSYRILQRLGWQDLRSGARARILRGVFGAAVPLLFSYQLKGQNAVRARYGLRRFKNYLEGFTFGDLTLYADAPAVAEVSALAPNERYVGPVCWTPDVPLPEWWDSLREDRPIVYLALGSSGELGVVRSALDVLLELGAQPVVSTAGRVYPPMPKGVFSADFLPGAEVSRRSALVVSNGGSPTTYQALLEGTPVLGIASNMDQLVSMTAVEQTGAGELLRADCFSAERFRSAVVRMLSGNFRSAAAAISVELRKFDPRELFPQAVGLVLGEDERRAAAYSGRER